MDAEQARYEALVRLAMENTTVTTKNFRQDVLFNETLRLEAAGYPVYDWYNSAWDKEVGGCNGRR